MSSSSHEPEPVNHEFVLLYNGWPTASLICPVFIIAPPFYLLCHTFKKLVSESYLLLSKVHDNPTEYDTSLLRECMERLNPCLKNFGDMVTAINRKMKFDNEYNNNNNNNDSDKDSDDDDDYDCGDGDFIGADNITRQEKCMKYLSTHYFSILRTFRSLVKSLPTLIQLNKSQPKCIASIKNTTIKTMNSFFHPDVSAVVGSYLYTQTTFMEFKSKAKKNIKNNTYKGRTHNQYMNELKRKRQVREETKKKLKLQIQQDEAERQARLPASPTLFTSEEEDNNTHNPEENNNTHDPEEDNNTYDPVTTQARLTELAQEDDSAIVIE